MDVTLTLGDDYRPFRHLVDVRTERSGDWVFTPDEDPYPFSYFYFTYGVPETLSVTYHVARRCEGTDGPTTGQARFNVRVRGLTDSPISGSVDLTFPACDSFSSEKGKDGSTARVAGLPPGEGAASQDDGACSMTHHGGSVARIGGIAVVALGVLASCRRRFRRRG